MVNKKEDFIPNPSHKKKECSPWDLSEKLFNSVWSIFLIGFTIYSAIYLPIEITIIIGLVSLIYFIRKPDKKQSGNLAINQPNKEQEEKTQQEIDDEEEDELDFDQECLDPCLR